MFLDTDSLAERVWRFIQKHDLILGQETLVIGVSGGPDSVCLLHLLAELKERLNIRLHVAHLNHMLRGDESVADAEYVSSLAHRLQLPATIEARDVESYRTKHHLSLEEAAREVRYQFLAEVASSVGANRIAVGHTADDQLETILMHLVRGAGAYGLQGMRPLTIWKSAQGLPLSLVRPLLEVTRKETEAYCQEHHLQPRLDSSNLSHSYLRNRVRRELIPLLQSYNPNIARALSHTTQVLTTDSSFFEQQLSQIWGNVVEERDGVISLDTKQLSSLHPALQRYLIREVLSRLLGSPKDIEWKHIEEVRAALSWKPGKQLSLPKGLMLYVGYGKCRLTTKSASLCPFPPLLGEYPLKVPGETHLPGWEVTATILEAGKYKPEGNALVAYLDFGSTGERLWVRGRKPGDLFQPLGMAQPKKLQSFMVDAKIPRMWRDHIPLVCSQHILWVVGWRIDDRVKVTEDTKQVLCLQFLQVP